MNHQFDVDIAIKYGVNAALILSNMEFWIAKSRANGVKYFDGHYWTYNSIKALKDLFPYLSERQISTAIKKLIDDGAIITGNYNKSAYDRTTWYAITEKGYSILQNCEMENTKAQNQNPENVKPIPDINTDSIPDSKPDKKERKTASGYDEIITAYTTNEELKQALYEFIKMRKLIKKPLTDYGLKRILSQLDRVAGTDGEKLESLNQSIMNNWQGVYEPKNKQNTISTNRQAPARQETEAERQNRELNEQIMAMVEGKSS